MDLYARMAADPSLMASVSMNLWVDYMRLWQSSWMKMLGMDAPPVAALLGQRTVRQPLEYSFLTRSLRPT